MKHNLPALFLLALGLSLSACTDKEASASNTDHVNVFIGTGGHGHTFPGATLPHGMVQLSPDTRLIGWDACSGYHYSDSTIIGFSHTHLSGTGIGDYGDILFMPVVGDKPLVAGDKYKPGEDYRARFSHDQEEARPGYYRVFLPDDSINVELTATTRAGMHRYTFPAKSDARLIIDMAPTIHGHRHPVTQIRVLNDSTIAGMKYTEGWAKHHYVYFHAVFSSPFDYKLYSDTIYQPDSTSVTVPTAKAVLSFRQVPEGGKVTAKVGISSVDEDGARRNVEAEMPGWDFDAVARQATDTWNKALGVIDVETDDDDSRTVFYTALYHSMLQPSISSDVDGRYRTMAQTIEQDTAYTNYTVFSLWDTFRSLHPLLVLLEPDRVNAMIEALLNSYDEGGWIPKWPSPGYSNIMHGTHGDAVIADAYVKGLRNYDERKALEAMMKNATTKGTGHYVARVGILDFIRLGYVPTDKYGESAIRTLEFSYDDFCIAQMARAMGDGELYGRMMVRAMNYINILDPETRMVRGRNSDGQWRDAKDPSISGWAQGSDRDRETYFRNITLFVPHDVQGLANFMGGNKALEEYLDYFFDNDFYYVGDEYSMHSPYLYNFIGKAWKTQRTIRRLLDYNFTNDSWGLPGNDDCGQMSSWYVMGAMGFYPVCPGIPAYQIGSPVVDRLELSLANGKTFTLIAENNSPENVYIQSAELNGQPYTKCWISHDDIMDGGTLVLRMGSRPNRKWGASAEDILPSVSAPAGE